MGHEKRTFSGDPFFAGRKHDESGAVSDAVVVGVDFGFGAGDRSGHGQSIEKRTAGAVETNIDPRVAGGFQIGYGAHQTARIVDAVIIFVAVGDRAIHKDRWDCPRAFVYDFEVFFFHNRLHNRLY